jgi:hypothetical protein
MKNMSVKFLQLLALTTILLSAISFQRAMGIDDNSYLKTDFGIVAREGIANTVKPSKSNSHEILVNRAVKVNLCCHWREGDLSMKLIDPFGNVIDSSKHPAEYDIDFIEAKTPQLSIALACYSITESYPTGAWTVEIYSYDSNTGIIEYSIGLYYEEPELDINTSTDKEHPKTGEPITIATTLERKNKPVLGATVRAIIGMERKAIDTLTLYDDGKHDDSLANDGRYAFEYIIPPRGGYYSVSIFAKKTGDNAFDRIDETAFIAHVNKSSIGEPVSERVIDTTGDGLYDQLIISYSFNIIQKDYYEMGASLHDRNNELFCNAGVDTILSPGSQIVEFVFDGDEIYDHGVDGPYIIEGVSIADTSGLLDHKENVYSTKEYSYREFQHSAIVYTGNQSIKELDIDGDGLIDSLVYFFEVDLLNEGNYRWQGQLREPESLKSVGFAKNSGYVKSGISTVNLSFSGSEIRKIGIDGPYEVWAVIIYSESYRSPYNDLRLKTREYKYTDFE